MFPKRIKRVEQGLRLAMKLAKESPFYRCKTGCIITDKQGKVVSYGVNSFKTHPFQAKYAIKNHVEHKIHIHAEIDAITKMDSPGYNIFIARIKKDKSSGLAKPCTICINAIMDVGIKNIHWTVD